VTGTLFLHSGALGGDILATGPVNYDHRANDVSFSIEAGTRLELRPPTQTSYSWRKSSTYGSFDISPSSHLVVGHHARLRFDSTQGASVSMGQVTLNGGHLYLAGMGASISLTGLHMDEEANLTLHAVSAYISGHLYCLSGRIGQLGNTGAFVSASSEGLLDLDCHVDNATFSVQGGNLAVRSASFLPHAVDCQSGVLSFLPGVSLAKLQRLTVSGGLVSFDDSYEEVRFQSLLFLSGTLRVLGALHADNLELGSRTVSYNPLFATAGNLYVKYMRFYGGTITGLRTDARIAVATKLTVSGTASKYLESVQLELPNSTITSFGGGFTFYLRRGATVSVPAGAELRLLMTSQSLFVDQSGSPYVPDATLINHGLLVFRPQYRQSNVQITSGLLNYGTMVVEGGELMLQDACQGDGTVDVREGAVLTFQQVSSSCSSYDCAFHKHFTVNSSLIGKGTIRVEASAGLDVSSAYIAPSLLWEIKSGGLTLHAVHPVTFDEPVAVSSGTLTVEGNTVAFRNLIVSGGTVNLRSPSQVEELHQSGGILMLSDTASIAGGRWLGGTWQGLRSTVLHLQDLTICGSSSHFFRDLQLNVSGSIKWQGSGHIYGYGNTQVRQTQIASPPPLSLSHT
jgi:hypothetical protein